MDQAVSHQDAVSYSAEAFTLLGISLLMTALRTYYRVRVIKIKRFQADDYFVILASIAQILETLLAYASLAVSYGLANNSMSDEYRARLSPDSHEYRIRVIGAKIQVAGWLTYACAIWSLKIAVCSFYLRLVDGLRKHRRRIIGAFVTIGLGWVVVILTILLSCRPLRRMWQLYPNPGNRCQAEISIVILATSYSFNVLTDLYLISIPLPILFKSHINPRAKIGLSFLFSCAIFIIIAASLRMGLILANPAESASISGPWAVRETFVAVVVTNLLVLFPLFKTWFRPLLRSSLRLLSHTGWPSRSRREKDLEKQEGSSKNDDRGRESGIRSIRISGVAGQHGTPIRSFNVERSGLWTDDGLEDNTSCLGSIRLEGTHFDDEDEAALNRTTSRGSDSIVIPVPPCKIRKDVDVSVEEDWTPSSHFGNFTSAWGPERKPPGPGLPLDMRTPYLTDHLQPAASGSRNKKPSCMRRFTG